MLPTIRLPSPFSESSSAPAGIPDAAATLPAVADEAPPSEDPLPSPPPRGKTPEVSSWRPQIALGPLAVGLSHLQRWARAVASAAGEQYRSIAELTGIVRNARPRWPVYAAVGVSGLGVGIGIVALAVSLAGRHDHKTAESNRTSATLASASRGPEPAPSASQAMTTPGAAEPAQQPSGAGTAPALDPCTVVSTPKTIAPSALVAAGIEVRSLGDDVALGFASSEHQAEALRLDPGTLAVTATATARSKTMIGRVTPAVSAKGGLRAVIDAERKADPVRGRRTIPGASLFQVGESSGSVVWARPGGGPAGALWPLDSDGVDAARASSEGSADDSTTAIAFRSEGSIEVGLASGRDALSAKGDLTKFAGLGPTVGAPAIAMNDGIVLVAWADRPSADVPWGLRWVRFKAGDAPGDPTTFTPPAGGRGEQAMSPSIAVVPSKRFLLVWTEGPASRHDVRGVTLSEDGAPIGSPLVISGSGVNAGEGQAAVASGGHGVVAFLESSDDRFKVAVVPIACGM